MGHGNLTPSGTRRRHEKIIDYRIRQISVTKIPKKEIRRTENEDLVVSRICQAFDGFERLRDGCEWISNGSGISEKVVAETRHGAELRIKYNPYGHKTYNVVVVTSNQGNLALSHLHTYTKQLTNILQSIYGEVRRQSGRYMSEKIEV